MAKRAAKNLAHLTAATESVRRFDAAFNAEKQRREDLAVKLLNAGFKPDDVQAAADVNWRTLASWLSDGDELLVPEDVAIYVHGKADEVASRRRHVVSVSSSQQDSSTDDEQAYAHLTETIREKQREYEASTGHKWFEGADPEIDDLVKISDNFFV